MNDSLLPLKPYVKALSSRGATCYLVGGAVRDFLIRGKFKGVVDFDIEVHGVSEHDLLCSLESLGVVLSVGKRFGIFKTPLVHADWALPRTDSVGRRPNVLVDQNLGIQKALLRRDLTINAIALNLNLYFQGRKLKKCLESPAEALFDLRHKIARPVDEATFVEDPLRFFRVMQFVSRFGLKVSSELSFVAKNMPLDFENKSSDFYLSKERVTAEFEKLLGSKNCSKGLFWLKKTTRLLSIFPELRDVVENNLFEDLCCSLDFAIFFKKPEERIKARLAVLSFFLQERAGAFFARFCFEKNLLSEALKLSSKMRLFNFEACYSVGLKFLAHELRFVSLEFFFKLLLCVKLINRKFFRLLMTLAKRYGVCFNPEAPIVTGNDIMFLEKKELFGVVLQKFYALQLIFGLTKKSDLLDLKHLALAGF